MGFFDMFTEKVKVLPASTTDAELFVVKNSGTHATADHAMPHADSRRSVGLYIGGGGEGNRVWSSDGAHRSSGRRSVGVYIGGSGSQNRMWSSERKLISA